MILEEIAEKTRLRIAEAKKKIPEKAMRALAEELRVSAEFPFTKALKAKGLSVICEVKKASPSKGVIAEEFPYKKIAREYELAGANAISCLTEPFYFQGENTYLQEIAATAQIPVLRKDFTVDPYMIHEAKLLGASAVLLIVSLLDAGELREYLAIAKHLGLSALVETHDEREIETALSAGAEIIGVNNRNLKDFTVDTENSVRLRKLVPKQIPFVSESGIKTHADMKRLFENGTDAVLIGETLMRAEDKKQALQELLYGEVQA